MATRTQPPRPQPPQLTPPAMEAAIPRLKKRIEELKALDTSTLRKRGDPRFHAVEDKIQHQLGELFGQGTDEFHRFSVMLDTAGLTMGYETPLSEVQAGYREGIDDAISKLQTVIAIFEEKIEDERRERQGGQPVNIAAAFPAERPRLKSRDVFVVHGRDEAAKQQVARFLEKLDLNPIVLHEQANAGRTIIEKFEDHAGKVAFAVVLLTPDDVGHLNDGVSEPAPRARQNVIFELGFFLGALGREKVAALYKGGVEIPSDYGSVIYTEMDDKGGWKFQLGKEIRAAGIEIDFNKIA